MPRRNDIAGRKSLIVGSGRKSLIAIAMLVVFLGAMASPMLACTRSLDTIQVTSDFRVTVRHGSIPVAGVKVEVYDERELHGDNNEAARKPILRLVTSRDGFVEVKNLGKGKYLVGITGPGGGSAVYAVIGDKAGKSRNEISLQWPYSLRETIKTKSLSGELASRNPWEPFENVHVELWNAGTETPLAIEETGTEGRFQFGDVVPGIYVLRIRGEQKNVSPDHQIEGDIAFELSPSSTDLPEVGSLYLGMTTCGITYSSCPIPSAEALPSRRLQVHDPRGVVIARAKYRVLDLAEAELAAGVTDSDGIIELPSELSGKVILVVAGTGTTTFTLPLDLLPPDDTASYLVVVMGVHGFGGDQCSAASLETHATQK